MVLFGTNRHFDLTNAPFSHAGAFLSIYQNPQDGSLYFTHCRCESVIIKRPNLMRIAFTQGAKELPFLYEADESKLTVTTPGGTAEFTYDGPQMIRIRLKNIGLRIFYEAEMHEGADIRDTNELEVGINFMGKLLFKGITGGFSTNAHWNFREVRPFPFTIDITPGADGCAEAAVHEYYSSGLPCKEYRPFDEAQASMLQDFEKFLKSYQEVPKVYSEFAHLCAWVVWMSQMGPRGSLKETVIFMHKLLLVRAAGWQQCYAAMAMTGHVKRAWAILQSFFQFQDELGGIPDNTADMNQENWVSTKPPLFGYAVCHILENFDTSALTKADYQNMYDKLAPYRNWWFHHHDHAKTGYPSYYHVDESGYDEASIFEKGLPLQSPDLLSYMALLDDALARLAGILGKDEEAKFHESESKRLIRYLTEELWDGEQFLARVTATGELYKCGCAAQLQPVLLGKRLPKAIVRKIRDRVLDETEFLTDYGITSENMKSPLFTMRSFTRGPVIAPVNMLILSGLYDAGETDAARKIARRFLQALMIHGPVLGVSPFRRDLGTYKQLDGYAQNQIGNPVTAWSASVFLALAGRFFR